MRAALRGATLRVRSPSCEVQSAQSVDVSRQRLMTRDDGSAAVAQMRAQEMDEQLGARMVERVERLVEQPPRARREQQTRERDAAALSVRQGPARSMSIRRDGEYFERIDRAARVDSIQAAPELEVLQRRQHRRQRVAHADVVHVAWLRTTRELAGFGKTQSREDFQQARLARA